jgi:glucan phosphoethanolaminetransferase (alkaline phosphatase superfamily)
MTTNTSDRESERELNVHIFSVSAQLVGLCLTVIGLFRVIVQLKSIDSLADNVLSADAILFLVACVFAYASLRSRNPRRRTLERIADVAFGTGLVLMTVVCALIAWELV